jgi:pyruvate-formate lyase-activating enzyme
MARVLAFLLPSGIRQLHLLPFHQYGEPKYRLLGQQWEMRQVAPPEKMMWQKCVKWQNKKDSMSPWEVEHDSDNGTSSGGGDRVR